jgi:hypothetical protein
MKPGLPGMVSDPAHPYHASRAFVLVGASHVPMVSHPNEVAKVILSATASVNGI